MPNIVRLFLAVRGFEFPLDKKKELDYCKLRRSGNSDLT